MDILFIAKLLGLYFIIVSAICIFRRKSMIPVIRDLLRNRPLLIALATVELAAGLALVLVFPKIAMSLEGLISLVGYVLIIEGIMYYTAPQKLIRRFIESFNRPYWYVSGGILGLVYGIYLTGKGFGLF